MAASQNGELTIDQLAQRTGMTVRNIRAHQSRGLLPPPDVRGRTGFYDSKHVARIELIKELQADGYSLDLIGRLIEGGGAASGDMLRFSRALREPFAHEEPEVVEIEELAEIWGAEDAQLLRRAVKLGLVRPLGDDRFEIVSPRLARAGAELAALGVPPTHALAVVSKIRKSAESVANTFAELFVREVWQPFEDAGHPDEKWSEVVDALERLRPLASEALLAVFGLAMNDVVEREFGRRLQRQGRADSRRKRR